MDSRLRLLGVVLMLFSITAQAGGIKKWVDQDGTIHFGDVPPTNADSEPAEPKIIPPSTEAGASQADFLRPGERRMLRRYEQRGRNLATAREDEHKKLQQQRRNRANSAAKCRYHRSRREYLERQLRRGYKHVEKEEIEQKIVQHRVNQAQFCK